MGLLPAETGMKLGYEDYHGDIFDEDHNHIGHWNYDKRQSQYIAAFDDKEKYGRKRFYGGNVQTMIKKMENYLDNKNKAV